MFIINIYILSIIFLLTQEKHLSKYKFLLYQTNESTFSLDDQIFNFILLPSTTSARMLFKARFPIKTFFEIDTLSPFIFVPEIFCLYCLNVNDTKIQTMKGNIYRGQFEDIEDGQIYLTNIVIEIIEVNYMEFLPPAYIETDLFIVLSNITDDSKGKSILVMKKNSEVYFDYFQIAKLYFYFEKKVDNFDFNIGDNIKILNGHNPLENGNDYSAMVNKDVLVKIIFNEVKSIYCEAGEKSAFSKNCFITKG